MSMFTQHKKVISHITLTCTNFIILNYINNYCCYFYHILYIILLCYHRHCHVVMWMFSFSTSEISIKRLLKRYKKNKSFYSFYLFLTNLVRTVLKQDLNSDFICYFNFIYQFLLYGSSTSDYLNALKLLKKFKKVKKVT